LRLAVTEGKRETKRRYLATGRTNVNAKTLSFTAVLFGTGCSSKSAENGCHPNGTGADAASEDIGAFNEMPTGDDKFREDDALEPDPVDGNNDRYTVNKVSVSSDTNKNRNW
jgi:hypothetical protein